MTRHQARARRVAGGSRVRRASEHAGDHARGDPACRVRHRDEASARTAARPAGGDDLNRAAGVGDVRAPKPLERLQEMAEDIDRVLFGEIAQRRRSPGEDICSLLVAAGLERRGDSRSADDAADRRPRDDGDGLAWTIDLLARHPEVIDRARTGGDAYLRAVVSEGLRLRPVVPLAGRRLTVDLRSTASRSRPAPTSRRRSGSRTRARRSTRSRTRSGPSASSTARRRPTRGSRSAAACAAASAPPSRSSRCASCWSRSCACFDVRPAGRRASARAPQRHVLAANGTRIVVRRRR